MWFKTKGEAQAKGDLVATDLFIQGRLFIIFLLAIPICVYCSNIFKDRPRHSSIPIFIPPSSDLPHSPYSLN